MPFVLEGPKWGNPTYGTAVTVTWSFADNPALDTTVDFDATITGSFRDLVRAVFQQWDLLTGITFVEVADSASSQIRVGENFLDGAGSQLGLARWSFSGGSITSATIEFDTDAFSDPNKFYLVGLHELGHAIGLDHSPSAADLMFGTLTTQTGLSIDDIRGARTLYNNGATLEGNASPNVLNGTANDDLVYGYEGGDTINGLGGNDVILGGRDSSDGPDSITTGGGNDLVFGNGGADTLTDSGGANTIVGGFGADSIVTGAASDGIYANQDNDIINAGDGNNVIVAGLGNDSVVTGVGADTIIGSEGNDTLRGGAGGDRYLMFAGSGGDLIFGFNFAEGDRLDIQGQGRTIGTSAGGFALISLTGGGTVELNGIAAASVQASWFV